MSANKRKKQALKKEGTIDAFNMSLIVVSAFAIYVFSYLFANLSHLELAKSSFNENTITFIPENISARPYTDKLDLLERNSYLKVKNKFEASGYNLSIVREKFEVPFYKFKELPYNLDAASPEERKNIFIQIVLPMILFENEKILSMRNKIIEIRKAGNNVSNDDKKWLNGIFELYHVDEKSFDEILKRVDIIPPSIAIAQAAKESGWGSSRFSIEGNALFGVWDWNEDAGIIPSERNDDSSHVVKKYPNLEKSISNYLKNINTHFAYVEFREERFFMRENNISLNPFTLLAFLENYSEERDYYIDDLEKIILGNGLIDFDRTILLQDSTSLI